MDLNAGDFNHPQMIIRVQRCGCLLNVYSVVWCFFLKYDYLSLQSKYIYYDDHNQLTCSLGSTFVKTVYPGSSKKDGVETYFIFIKWCIECSFYHKVRASQGSGHQRQDHHQDQWIMFQLLRLAELPQDHNGVMPSSAIPGFFFSDVWVLNLSYSI